MVAILNHIQNNYIQELPGEIPQKVAQSVIVTVAISLFSGATRNIALLGGAIAGTTTVIEAVTRPILNAIFPENPMVVRCIQIVAPRLMALGLAASLAPWLGVAFQTDGIVLPLIAWFVLNDRYVERNVAMVEVL